jgi:hypothetical protein
MSKLLKDASGVYNLEHVSSIHPINIKGDKQDQSKVTAVHTAIAMVGGQTHHTTIPWSAAAAIVEDFLSGGVPQKPATPAPAPAPPLTDAQKLEQAQGQYSS